MDGALTSVPRLSEKILGSQEAALRELLRRFRDGDIDGALKRALPMGEPGSRIGRAADNAILPTHNLSYSLGNILNWQAGGGSAASIWFGGMDIQRELMREYRKAAEAAVARGDWKRAAFIYGKLLADWREAAAVLSRGGLHHDAAILYRDKLGDPLRAAVCLEAGGEFDAALAIYDRLREHEKAGDLLRRMGEEEAAIERYVQAAEAMIERKKGPLAAGEFILRKTSRADLAETYFSAGWSLRFRSLELGNAVPCAVHLATIYSERADEASFFTLLQEGEDFFAPPGNAHAAGQFFNTVTRLADREVWQDRKDELRDRCLLGLAAKLRDQAETDRHTGSLISNLLGSTGNWEPPVVSDAVFAVKQPQLRAKNPSFERPSTTLSLGQGTITAAVQAPESGEIFVGFDNGILACFQPAENRVIRLGELERSITGLAVDHDGDFVVVARHEFNNYRLTSYLRLSDDQYQAMADRFVTDSDEFRLAPWVTLRAEDDDYLTVLRRCEAEAKPMLLRGVDLLMQTAERTDCTDPACLDVLLERSGEESAPRWLVFESHRLHYVESRQNTSFLGRSIMQVPLNWRPEAHPDNSVEMPSLSCQRVAADQWELAGLGEAGGIYWLRLVVDEKTLECPRLLATNCANGYRCATLVRPGVVAGITAENRLIWLRAESDRLKEFAPSQRLPSTTPAAACFCSRETEELFIVLQNGTLLRMPVAK
jgi:tetratricopeptide (TPR) repeat protein